MKDSQDPPRKGPRDRDRQGSRPVLLVAPVRTPPGAREEIEAGLRPRIDYLDLATRLHADLLDATVCDRGWRSAWEPVDRATRMAWGQAVAAFRERKGRQVICSLGEDVGIPLALLLRACKIRPRHLVIAHNVLSRRKVGWLRLLGVMSRFDRIVALSSEARDDIVRTYGLQEHRAVFLIDAVDQRFWRPQPGLAAEEGLILSVGGAKRDYEGLIRAVQGLPVRVQIQAGSQWLGRGNARTVPEAETVRFGGHLSFTELRDLYGRCAFAVIPLLPGAHHSAGTVSIKEAMAMEKAVIVACEGGAQEYVVHGQTGLVVPVSDPLALREAIRALSSDTDLARRMGRAGREAIETRMRYEEKIEGLARLVGELVSTPGGGARSAREGKGT